VSNPLVEQGERTAGVDAATATFTYTPTETQRLKATSRSSQQISVTAISGTSTLETGAWIPILPINPTIDVESPRGIALNSDGTMLYVATNDQRSLEVINTGTGKIVNSVPLNAPTQDIAMGADGAAYITDITNGRLLTYRNGTVGSTSVPGCTGIAVSANGRYAYAGSNSGTVSVIDTGTSEVVTKFSLGSMPQGIAYSNVANVERLYVSSIRGSAGSTAGLVSVIEINSSGPIPSLKLIKSINVGSSSNYPGGLAVSPDGKRVYVANNTDGTVSVISTASNSVVKTISTGAGMFSGPLRVAVSPDGIKLFVTNAGTSNVSVINTSTYAVTQTIPVGPGTDGLAVSPDGKRIYVAATGNDSRLGDYIRLIAV
jgi:YVTN family beta-propeller protein